VPGYSQERGCYFCAVKDNQPTLRQDIADLWDLAPLPSPDVSQANKHGDRVEQRSLWVSNALVGYSDWPYMAQVCRLERAVTRKGKTSHEVAYGVTSLSCQQARPKRLMALWRGHWGIEDRTQWVRDVTFDEDRCQIRTEAAPQIVAALRNLSISLLRLASKLNICRGAKEKRRSLNRSSRHGRHPPSITEKP